MGLLNNFFGSPDQTQALGLLGVGMMNGGFGQGAGMAMQHLAGAGDRDMKRQYMQQQMGLLGAQMEEAKAQALERQQKLELARRQEELQRRLLFGDPSAMTPPGGAAPAGMPPAGMPPQGGMPPVPGAAPQPAAQGQGGIMALSQQLGIPPEAIQADYVFNGGKKISELLAARAAPKWENVNGNLVNVNAPGFQGGFQPGVNVSNDGKATMWQPDGQGGLVVGAPRGALETFGAYQNIGEGTKASYDPVQVIGPDGAARFVPRSQVVGQPPRGQGAPSGGQRSPTSSMPGEADRFAILSQELARAQQQGNKQDVQAIQNEIARLPASARTGSNPSGLAVPGFQATPTTQQAADAAAAKVRAEADARAESDRQAGRTKKSDSSTEMLAQIQRARNLLSYGPTNSSTGAVVDKVLSSVGVSTDSANYASALDTISGWLTSNTPRMEGPQSNIDQENYKIMAGRVGDRTIPVDQRLAALNEVERIQARYANVTPTDGTEPKKANIVPELPKQAAKGQRARDLATGEIMVFNGMSWVKAK